MTVAKDELFCRLAIRQGLLTKETAIEALRRYRSEGKTKEEIGQFLLREGVLEKPQVSQLQSAIQRRASGHVTETKQRVPLPRGKSRSTRPPVHRRPGPVSPGSNAAQITAVSIAGVVLVVAILLLIFQLQEKSPPPPAETPAGATVSSPPTTVPKPQAETLPAQLELSQEELASYGDRLQLAITTARQEQLDGRINQGLIHLRRAREQLGGDRLPEALRQVIDQEIKSFETFLRERYEEELTKLKAAREAGRSADEMQPILEKIELACGKELRQEAEKSLGLQVPSDKR